MDRIDVLYSHSYEDDYFHLDDIQVYVEDVDEKKRIENKVSESGLLGSLEYPDRDFQNRIARILEVDSKIINVDTEEIDLM